VAIQANRPNNRIFLVLGVVLAALAFGGVLFALRQASGNTTAIVVAKTSLSAGTTITADDLTTASVPQAVKPADAYTNPSDVVSKTLSASVAPNTPMTPALFQQAAFAAPTSAASGSGSSAATVPVSIEPQLTKGFVAMAIPAAGELPAGFTGLQQNNVTPELVSAGYYIQAGDHIDILVLDSGPNNTVVGTRFAFQDIPVLRVGTAGSAANAAATVYIVEVARSQAELLEGLITGQGHETVIKYVLRPQSEWGKFANNTYAPNYEPSTGPGVPPVADRTVTPSSLDSLFGH
jgi:Flp pilus assembly protein CpaB